MDDELTQRQQAEERLRKFFVPITTKNNKVKNEKVKEKEDKIKLKPKKKKATKEDKPKKKPKVPDYIQVDSDIANDANQFDKNKPYYFPTKEQFSTLTQKQKEKFLSECVINLHIANMNSMFPQDNTIIFKAEDMINGTLFYTDSGENIKKYLIRKGYIIEDCENCENTKKFKIKFETDENTLSHEEQKLLSLCVEEIVKDKSQSDKSQDEILASNFDKMELE